MLINHFLFNTTLLWYDLVVFTIFEQVELRPKLNLVYGDILSRFVVKKLTQVWSETPYDPS